MTVTLQARVAPSPDTVFRDLDGEAVILHLESGLYYGLDPVGTRVWTLMGRHPRLREIVDVLLDEYEVDRERLERDLIELVSKLAERSLVHVEPEAE